MSKLHKIVDDATKPRELDEYQKGLVKYGPIAIKLLQDFIEATTQLAPDANGKTFHQSITTKWNGIETHRVIYGTAEEAHRLQNGRSLAEIFTGVKKPEPFTVLDLNNDPGHLGKEAHYPRLTNDNWRLPIHLDIVMDTMISDFSKAAPHRADDLKAVIDQFSDTYDEIVTFFKNTKPYPSLTPKKP